MRFQTFTPALLVAAILFAGCDADSRDPDGGGGGVDAGSVDDASTSECPASIEEGLACATPGQFCGGEACTSPCDFCNIWECREGSWQGVEAFPADCFDCGSERCRSDTEYCRVTFGGAPPGTRTDECVRAPDACEGDPSCACIDESGSTCDESGDGVVVTVSLP